jgi:DNA mismatch repair protein MutL
MPRVKLLPEDTSRKLAAGEVIVRPASVVKELLENSLDAGARRITVELKDGGRTLIRISDDGCGMSREDLCLAIHRHSTSKLNDIEDLRHLTSYGFRGEALASIAAVSRLRVESAAADAPVGTFIQVEGSEIKEIGDTARAKGTSVSVNQLFYNLPVRRGFLKSDSYEVKLVLETVKQYALVFPDVHFALRSNGEEQLLLPPAAMLRDRLGLFLDADIAGNLVELSADNALVKLTGLLVNPFHVRESSFLQQVFINRRPVRNRVVTRAVYDAYGETLRGGNPTFVLMIETAPEQLDVNIHPTKQEVKFSDERFLFQFVSEAVRQALGLKRAADQPAPDMVFETSFDAGSEVQGFWQLHSSFIFAQVRTGYCIIDQHAAHERILYEDILKTAERSPEQGLLFPLTIELTPEEYAVYEETRTELATLGIQSKPFSGQTVVVEALPAGTNMTRDEVRDIFTELARADRQTRNRREELAKTIACKGAVKAGQQLAQSEMESLINRLFSCRNPFFCPHGRPAVIRVSLEDLERRFGRT